MLIDNARQELNKILELLGNIQRLASLENNKVQELGSELEKMYAGTDTVEEATKRADRFIEIHEEIEKYDIIEAK